MKSNYSRILFTTASLALGVGTASAANKYWSGTGNWADSLWANTAGGDPVGDPPTYTYDKAWAIYDQAVFEGSAGTVTIAGSQTANTLNFTTDGYLVTGGTLGFGSPGINNLTVASGVTATIQPPRQPDRADRAVCAREGPLLQIHRQARAGDQPRRHFRDRRGGVTRPPVRSAI